MRVGVSAQDASTWSDRRCGLMVPWAVGEVASARCDRPSGLVGLEVNEFTYYPDDVTGQLNKLG